MGNTPILKGLIRIFITSVIVSDKRRYFQFLSIPNVSILKLMAIYMYGTQIASEIQKTDFYVSFYIKKIE